MLARTISKHRGQPGQALWRRVLVPTLYLAAIVTAVFLIPRSLQRVRDLPQTEEELKAAARTLRPSDEAPLTGSERKKAAFGRKLFFDKALSGDGQTSCASCHVPEKFFTDGQTAPVAGPMAGTEIAHALLNTPGIANGRLVRWSFADGRSDSLGAQAVSSLEDPEFMASSRVHVARYLAARQRDAYEEAFGPFPAVLMSITLPPHGLPRAQPAKLPIATAAHALATIRGEGQLLDILAAAQRARVAPAMELSRRTQDRPLPPLPWAEAYERLDDDVKAAVDLVVGRVGSALASYERQLVTTPSAFDRFTERLAAGDSLEQARAAGPFTHQELTGFKLFVGPGGCIGCHSGPGLSDQSFHNIGLSYQDGPVRLGRASGVLTALGDPFNCYGGYFPTDTVPASDETGRCGALSALEVTDVKAVGAFKTPSLRNVAETAPYMHDGRFKTMREVLAYYSTLEGSPAIGERDASLAPLHLTNEEIDALLSFLQTLSSPIRDLSAESTVSSQP